MALVVLDSTNTEAVLADARGEEAPKAETKTAEVTEVIERPKDAKDADNSEDQDEIDFATELGITKEQQERFQKILQREVGKKHRRAKEAEEFAADQMRTRILSDQKAKEFEDRLKAFEKPVSDPDGEPTRDKFKTDEDYGSALLDYRVDQRLKEREKQQAAQRQQEIAQTAAQRIQKALEIVPDYQEVTEAADYIVPGNIGVMMQESPMFAELGYHFAKSPDELGKLAILSQERAKVAFREIEARMTPFSAVKSEKAATGSQPATPQASTKTDVVPSKPRAPAPITPLSTASSGQVVKDEVDMNIREVITKYQKDKGANFQARKRH